MIMKIPTTTDLISECWMTAELAAREALSSHHWDRDEEFITELFIGELRKAVREASTFGQVREAFLQDLKGAFSEELGGESLEQIADGITATIIQHPRQIEATTGGDLGLVFRRPSVRRDWEGSAFVVDDNYQRGLLCQAKLNRRPRRGKRSVYGNLTPNQKRILPSHKEYLALILYRYADRDRRSLDPFLWQLCDGMSVDGVIECLRSGSFPDLLGSSRVIDLLGNDKIGTDDKKIIAEFIAPEVRPALIIRIGWPKGPPRGVVSHRTAQKERQVVMIGQS